MTVFYRRPGKKSDCRRRQYPLHYGFAFTRNQLFLNYQEQLIRGGLKKMINPYAIEKLAAMEQKRIEWRMRRLWWWFSRKSKND
ncbi:MAG: hypothetical protein ACE3JK_10915 [Sporolactobacillus sp.]